MKRIIVCCDGTWNQPDMDADGKPCPTNVTKIASRIPRTAADGTPQTLYYNTGVGTNVSALRHLISGAIGAGLDDKLFEAYRFLCKVYEPGDAIFLFGFSRGAFTVRSLGGMIVNSGIVRPAHESAIAKAIELYRSRQPERHPRGVESTLFRRTYCWEDRTPIQCIGVWDTVGSLGNPFRPKFMGSKWVPGFLRTKNQFHDLDLSTNVRNAFHAISIDERRRNFRPTLWVQKPDADGQTLQQQWFPGGHSDVGGSTPDPRLSDVALEWMVSRATGCGLEVDPPTPGGDAAHSSAPDPIGGDITDCYTGLWKLIPPLIRRIDDPAIAEKANVAAKRAAGSLAGLSSNETISESATRRWLGVAAYRPPNLVQYTAEHPGFPPKS